jgi:N-acyl-L-homoserine lactone synthetase
MEILDVALAPRCAEMALAGMFAARKQVFIDRLGWELPIRDGRFEVDQFDNPKASYLLLGRAGVPHRGSARLLQAEEPHILGDLFPLLCAGPIPRGPHVREITRFCIDPGLVNRRSIGTPYRRAKGTPLLSWWVVDAGRGFRAAGGVGRA